MCCGLSLCFCENITVDLIEQFRLVLSLFTVHFVGLSDEENVAAKPIQYIPPPPHMVPISSIPYRLPGMRRTGH